MDPTDTYAARRAAYHRSISLAWSQLVADLAPHGDDRVALAGPMATLAGALDDLRNARPADAKARAVDAVRAPRNLTRDVFERPLGDAWGAMFDGMVELARLLNAVDAALAVSEPGEPSRVFACQNCEWKGAPGDTKPARDVLMRHAPGDVFSDRECPDCGALCFPA